jgi:hypothetical protein
MDRYEMSRTELLQYQKLCERNIRAMKRDGLKDTENGGLRVWINRLKETKGKLLL